MAVPYDSPRIHLYTRIQKSPYYYASRRHGVKSYSVANRMYHPRHYTDPIEEYWRLVNDVTLWDVGVERQVEITGPDAAAFADLLTPRDLSGCEVDQAKFVLITDQEGGILNNPVLLRLAEDRFWLSVADGDVLYWAKGAAVHSGMEVQVSEPDVGPVQIQGPKSKALMGDLFGDPIEDLRYYRVLQGELDGMAVVVSRTGYTGEVGYEIYLHHASRDAGKLWDTILEAGEPHDLAVIGPSQIRRVEAGILSWGSDIALHNVYLNPYEVDLDWTVDLDQEADFIGRQALTRIAEEGVSRKVVGIEMGGDPVIGYIEDYLPVLDGEDRIGMVTSVFWSPRLERNIGYALVPIEHAAEGTTFSVDGPFRRVEATVVPKPFFDPEKEIPKG